MIATSVKVEGVAAVTRRFLALEARVRSTIVRRAARGAMRRPLVMAKSSTNFENQTGRLRRALRIGVGVRKRGLLTTGRVLAGKGARHATPLEYGHRIAVGSSGMTEKNVVLRRKDGRPKKIDQRYGRSAGRVAPRYFLRDTFRATTGTMARDFEASYIAGVNAAARA